MIFHDVLLPHPWGLNDTQKLFCLYFLRFELHFYFCIYFHQKRNSNHKIQTDDGCYLWCLFSIFLNYFYLENQNEFIIHLTRAFWNKLLSLQKVVGICQKIDSKTYLSFGNSLYIVLVKSTKLSLSVSMVNRAFHPLE